MATTQLETVKVTQLSKHGFFADKQGYYWSKQLKEDAKVGITPGVTVNMEIYTADSGAKYVNKVLNAVETADVPVINRDKVSQREVTTKVSNKPVKEETKLDNTMSKAEWSAKDRSQLIGGLSHDAAQLTAAFAAMFPDIATTEDALKLYKDFLVGMLKIRDEVK
jgi:hypothetical protein